MHRNRANRRARHTRRATATLALISAATFLNLLLLLFGKRYRLLLGSALAYYPGWLTTAVNGGIGSRALALLFGLGLCLAYVVCLCRVHRQGLRLGFFFYAADTAILLAVALFLVGNPESCLFELLIHGGILWTLYQGAAAQWQRKPAIR